jgi:hypothetical protein
VAFSTFCSLLALLQPSRPSAAFSSFCGLLVLLRPSRSAAFSTFLTARSLYPSRYKSTFSTFCDLLYCKKSLFQPRQICILNLLPSLQQEVFVVAESNLPSRPSTFFTARSFYHSRDKIHILNLLKPSRPSSTFLTARSLCRS